MKSKIKAWVSAARLRTLPLSLSGILVGSALGHQFLKNGLYQHSNSTTFFFETPIFWLAIVTTLGLQVLSNFANDYGDGIKGTDNVARIGPQRALQSGALTKKELVFGIISAAIFSFVSAIVLIIVAFGSQYIGYSLFFIILGILAIAAAIKYTMGDTAYGYKGFGDVFVFLFFGIVSVIGCCFLFTKTWVIVSLLPAITIGLLSTAVLNLNNMRDHDNDKASNKNTIVVKIGIQKAKIYHYLLIVVAMIAMGVFTAITYKEYNDLLYLIAFIPLGIHLRTVFKTYQMKQLDPELKKVALSTFIGSLLFCIGIIW